MQDRIPPHDAVRDAMANLNEDESKHRDYDSNTTRIAIQGTTINRLCAIHLRSRNTRQDFLGRVVPFFACLLIFSYSNPSTPSFTPLDVTHLRLHSCLATEFLLSF